MRWIKVTKETMPTDMEKVLLTVEHMGYRWVMEGRYNPEFGWEWPCNVYDGYWDVIRDKVTDWMPMPKPAGLGGL